MVDVQARLLVRSALGLVRATHGAECLEITIPTPDDCALPSDGKAVVTCRWERGEIRVRVYVVQGSDLPGRSRPGEGRSRRRFRGIDGRRRVSR